MAVKQINSLMEYLRSEKGIFIKGPAQKRKLRNIGYYHGYKGYRFLGKNTKVVNYTTFNELMAVYDFDMNLKAMFYPKIMFLETALKNYALEEALKKCNSDSFDDLYEKILTGYKNFPVNSRAYKEAISKRVKLRNRIYQNVSKDYSNKPVVRHFMRKGKEIPIWAIFEILTISDFGTLLTCLDTDTKKSISLSLGFDQNIDKEGELAGEIVYLIKDLRNAVAHNDAVLDNRFASNTLPSLLSKYLGSVTGIKNINFTTITDYILLICYLMTCFEKPRTEIKHFLGDFIGYYTTLRGKVSSDIFDIIIANDINAKTHGMYNYLARWKKKDV